MEFRSDPAAVEKHFDSQNQFLARRSDYLGSIEVLKEAISQLDVLSVNSAI